MGIKRSPSKRDSSEGITNDESIGDVRKGQRKWKQDSPITCPFLSKREGGKNFNIKCP